MHETTAFLTFLDHCAGTLRNTRTSNCTSRAILGALARLFFYHPAPHYAVTFVTQTRFWGTASVMMFATHNTAIWMGGTVWTEKQYFRGLDDNKKYCGSNVSIHHPHKEGNTNVLFKNKKIG